VLQPLLDDHATDAFYVDGAGHKTLAIAGGGLIPVKGRFLHDRTIEQARAAGKSGTETAAKVVQGIEAEAGKSEAADPKRIEGWVDLQRDKLKVTVGVGSIQPVQGSIVPSVPI